MEASGTGNMKFALNGALTIGTLISQCGDKEEVGDDNIFIFGLTVEELEELRPTRYDSKTYYYGTELKRALDQISNGFFSPDDKHLFDPIIHAFLHKYFMVLADYESYVKEQEK